MPAPMAAAGPAGSVADPAHAQRLAAYVGPNSEYYLRKWGELERGSSTSWNFAAFFLSALWLAYRKMLVPALAVVAVFFGAFLLQTVGEVPGAGVLSLIAAVGVGLMGNKFYRNQAEAAVRMQGGDPARLQMAGGVSEPNAIGLAVAYGAVVTGAVMYMMEERIGPFARTSTYRPYVSPPSGGGSTPASGDLVSRSWLLGTWGNGGCMTWIRFNSDGSISDNGNNTGSWSLNEYSRELTLTMAQGSRTGPVSRRGETLIIGPQEWRRC